MSMLPVSRLARRTLLIAAAVIALGAPPVLGQSTNAGKLDPLLQVRSRQLTGR